MLISPQKSFFINYTFMKLDQVVDVNKMKFNLIIYFIGFINSKLI